MLGVRRRSPLSSSCRFLRSALIVSLTVAAVFAVAAPSRGQGMDPVVEEHLPVVAQFYAAETGVAALACEVGCDALKVDLRRTPTVEKDPVGWRALRWLFDHRPTIPPPWKLPLVRLGPVAALVSGNYYVWKVRVLGAQPKDYTSGVPVEAFTLDQVDSWQVVDGISNHPYPSFQEKPNPLPIGVIARTDI